MTQKFTLILGLFCSLMLISGTIDLDNLANYANQTVPSYITKDNTPGTNPITDGGASLGRVLFYDTNLSNDNTIACASCHKQEFAFGDTAIASLGWQGERTGRHSMRLVNARFADEESFFWDERAADLEEQTTEPIQDHIEMGFSGTNGDLTFSDLITRLEGLSYYNELFTFVYGDATVTEERVQHALAQFIRSIQSFDSKYDIGRAQVNSNNHNFPNFTAAENAGKQLFSTPPPNGGAGCQGCHRAPEFDIDPNSRNNNVISVINNPGATDLTNKRAPSLRDMVNPAGELNGPLMHNGGFTSLEDVIEHYNLITLIPGNNQLDNRLRPGGNGQNLNLTATEKSNLVAFLQTLTGSEMYTAERYSDPFEPDGSITILNGILPVSFVGFTVEEREKTMALEWITENERNNSGFEVQFSEDAIDWLTVGFVEGKGNSDEETYYDFVHENPVYGKNHYRLKQIDIDGKVSYSQVFIGVLEQDDSAVQVSPNPVRDFLSLDLPEGQFELSVLNLQGKIVKHLSVENGSSVDLSGLQAGVYFARFESFGSTTELIRLIKL